jgi:hypothetical protein
VPDYVFDWAVIVLPTVLSITGVLVSLRVPDQRYLWHWSVCLIVFGLGVSVVTGIDQKLARDAPRRSEDALQSKYDKLHEQLQQVNGNGRYIQGQLDALTLMARANRPADEANVLVNALHDLSNRLPNLLTPRGSGGAQAPAPRSLDHVVVTGMPSGDALRAALIGGQPIDGASKAAGVAYVVVMVSDATRNSGDPDISTIQSVVNALRKLPGVKVFFADHRYVLSDDKDHIVFGVIKPLCGVSIPGAVFYYRKDVMEIAEQVRLTVDPLEAIKILRFTTV